MVYALPLGHLPLSYVFDLKIETRFVLGKYETPMNLTVQEYGTLGAGDENLDLFISTNNLHGDNVILLPPGFEVVVYV